MSDATEFVRVATAMTKPHAVFVFGSNEAGFHGAGAALTAFREYGAVRGVGEGICGRSYAIPTKDADIESRPLSAVKDSIEAFCRYALANPETTFVVTRIGCGLAGFTDEQIAPLFALAPANCELPDGWRSS